MSNDNLYDVTTWPHGNAADDIGAVINSIIADVKRRQQATDTDQGGKPGAAIVIPPGDYRLRTQVVIDISYLTIRGYGHGFTSSSIRYNIPEAEWPGLHELWPGGSRILHDLPAPVDDDPSSRAAFLVTRTGSPRISSVEFTDFCIDGLHFEADGSDLLPANTYVNGKTGIHVADANDSFRVNGMGLIYLEHGLVIHHADALSIHDNFIAECGNCIELRGWGQASKITDNLIGAGFRGHSIYAENHGGLLITANNVFPRGASSIHLRGVSRSSVSNNRLHSFYPGLLRLEQCSENLIASNHLLRDAEPWTPFLSVNNGLTDDYGVVTLHGDANSILGNHISHVVPAREAQADIQPPVTRMMTGGRDNYIATNHPVVRTTQQGAGNNAYAAQVEALTASATSRPAIAVLVDGHSTGNIILDTGTEAEVIADRRLNNVRPTSERT